MPNRSVLPLVPLLLFALAGPAGAAAQDLLGRSDSLYAAHDLEGSLAAATAALAADSTSNPAAWRVARAQVVLGILAEVRDDDWDGAERRFRAAIPPVAAAVARDSLDVDALYWLAAPRGRLALRIGGLERADMAESVWDLAHRVLVLDPGHAGAHNALGTLHHEIMAMPRLERFFAKVALGDTPILTETRWEGAEEHHRKAVLAEPETILYHYDLATTLLRRGRNDEAAEELRAVTRLPAVHLPDPIWQDQARRALARLEDRR